MMSASQKDFDARTEMTRTRILFLSLLAIALGFAAPQGLAQGAKSASKLPVPRYVSLRAGEVNMRTGPGVRYPIDWVYKRKNMPVEVIAQFGTWRKVRDFQGAQGWIHQSMLSGARFATITGQTRTMRRQADSKSDPVARIEPGAIAELLSCPEGTGWCRVSAGKYEGWLRRVEFWGLYPRESIK
jgi:SH3-like domain-containing protein